MRQWCRRSNPSPAGQWLGDEALCTTAERKQTWRLQPRPACLQDARRTEHTETSPQKCGPSRKEPQSQGPAPAPGTSSSALSQAFHPSQACLTRGELSWNSRGAGAPPQSGRVGTTTGDGPVGSSRPCQVESESRQGSRGLNGGEGRVGRNEDQKPSSLLTVWALLPPTTPLPHSPGGNHVVSSMPMLRWGCLACLHQRG